MLYKMESMMMKRHSSVDRRSLWGLLAMLWAVALIASVLYSISADDYQVQVAAGMVALICLGGWYSCVKLRQRYPAL